MQLVDGEVYSNCKVHILTVKIPNSNNNPIRNMSAKIREHNKWLTKWCYLTTKSHFLFYLEMLHNKNQIVHANFTTEL